MYVWNAGVGVYTCVKAMHVCCVHVYIFMCVRLRASSAPAWVCLRTEMSSYKSDSDVTP